MVRHETEQIELTEHTDHVLVVHDQEAVHAVADHHQQGVVNRGIAAYRDDVETRYPGYWQFARGLRQQ